MSNSSKKSMSGLGAVKRDFSSNMVKKELVPVVTASKRSSISDALRRAIEEGVASREADDKMKASQPSASSSATYNSSSKRSSASRGEAAPPAKRRQLPDSWDTSTPSSSYVSSYSTSTQSYVSTAASPPSSLSSLATGKNQPLIVPTNAANASANPAEIFLSNEQRQILQLVNEGKNIFYTGSAGTGKSVLLREIIRSLHKKFVRSQDAVAVTASTGIAACNIGGVTLHSFAGIGLGLESAEHLADKIKKNKKASTRWLRTRVLIIDEVSMIDGELFDKLARIGSLLRRKSEPFGGIQIVVTGDFFQLPPVNKGSKPMKFAFEADLWKVAIKRMIKLTKVFRQKDQEFVDMLNEMRYGTLSQKSIAKFKTLSREIIYEDGLGPTELFPRRQDVDSSNNVRMGRLRGENRTYTATDNGTANPEYRQKLLENLMAPERLTLATDAQVMLIKNVDETLVNGSMGKVVRFAEPSAYATEVGAPDVLFNEKPSSSAGGSSKKTQRTEQKYPVVEFTIPGGGRREYLVLPETWKIELPSGEIQASRIQLPLILSWAMSIHKSQGQTLDRVKVDLAKVFEKGQAYVALSRATSMDGLQVLNFSADKVFVHEKVRAWSNTLETLTS